MAKQTNMWVYVIVALIIGFLIGYVVAGGFAKAGKAWQTCPKQTGCSGQGCSNICGDLLCTCDVGGCTTTVNGIANCCHATCGKAGTA